MAQRRETEETIPLVQERLAIEKRAVETGRVRIRTVVDEKLARVTQDLERDDVTIERVPVNQEVAEVPQIREEDGVLIVPLLEEVVVVEKRLVLKEELRVTRNRKRERVDQAVRLRTMHADVHRARTTLPPSPPDGTTETRHTPRLHRKEPPIPRR